MVISGKSGYPVESTARGGLHVQAFERPEQVEWAEAGRLYVARVANTPTGAADVFAHLANTDANGRNLHVLSIETCPAGVETIDVYLGPNTALTGGTVTAVKSLAGSINAGMSVVFNVGVDITVFDATASSGVVATLGVAVSRTMDRTYQRIIVPPGWAVWLLAVTGAIAQRTNITFGFPFKAGEVA